MKNYGRYKVVFITAKCSTWDFIYKSSFTNYILPKTKEIKWKNGHKKKSAYRASFQMNNYYKTTIDLHFHSSKENWTLQNFIYLKKTSMLTYLWFEFLFYLYLFAKKSIVRLLNLEVGLLC